MRIVLLAVGNRMPEWVDSAVQEYQKRFSGDVRFILDSIPLPRRGSESAQVVRRREAERLRARLKNYPHAHHVALEVDGRQLSTRQLAEQLQTRRAHSQDLVLLVGGPEGLCPELSANCHERWSLSRLTLAHPLVRVLVAEQMYRCWTLMVGHPYHR